MEIDVKFELTDIAEFFGDTTNHLDSLQEALWQAIHESKPEALDWLAGNVKDIFNIRLTYSSIDE